MWGNILAQCLSDEKNLLSFDTRVLDSNTFSNLEGAPIYKNAENANAHIKTCVTPSAKHASVSCCGHKKALLLYHAVRHMYIKYLRKSYTILYANAALQRQVMCHNVSRLVLVLKHLELGANKHDLNRSFLFFISWGRRVQEKIKILKHLYTHRQQKKSFIALRLEIAAKHKRECVQQKQRALANRYVKHAFSIWRISAARRHAERAKRISGVESANQLLNDENEITQSELESQRSRLVEIKNLTMSVITKLSRHVDYDGN